MSNRMMDTEDAIEPISTRVSTEIPSPPQLASVTNEPYSIFDRRQKGLIVLIVSTAATCESLYGLRSVVRMTLTSI